MNQVRWVLLTMLALGGLAHAQSIETPPLIARVTDLTNTIPNEPGYQIGTTLSQYESTSGRQILVLVTPGTGSEEVSSYGRRVANTWARQRLSVRNAAILVIARDSATAWIGEGAGYTGQFSDDIRQRIVSEFIEPHLDFDDVTRATESGVEMLMRTSDGRSLPGAALPGTRVFWAFYQAYPWLIAIVLVALIYAGWHFPPAWILFCLGTTWMAAAGFSATWNGLAGVALSSVGLLFGLLVAAPLWHVRSRRKLLARPPVSEAGLVHDNGKMRLDSQLLKKN